jgi:UDPglucose 6-dehydrogenase
LIASGRRQDYPLRILEAVARVNAHQRVRFLERVIAHFDGDVAGKRLAIWGLAFKPRTNDIREAPSIDIIKGLLDGGATVVAYDPEAMDEARKVFAFGVEFAGSDYECLTGADALLLITEWQAFRNPNFDRMKDEMRQATVFDGRNVYDPENMREMGFTYYGIGRT